MLTYSLQSFVANDKMYYELTSNKGSIFNLIKEIDKDDLSINKYKHERYDKLVEECSISIVKYCKLNKKQLNNSMHDISYILVLLFIIMYYEQHTEKYIYDDLKLELNKIENINYNEDFKPEYLSFEDWFRISTTIKEYSLSDIKYKAIKSRTDISFVTYTNFGYIDYTKNLILSLEKCNFPLRLTVYCVDKKSYDILNVNKNINLKYLNDEDNQTEQFVKLYAEGWDQMMILKMKSIQKELSEYDYVFYTDSDIVFENNYCIQYLIDNLYDNDLLVQNNYNHEFCAGFMFIKSNDITKNIFETKDIDMKEFICDQPYLNSKKNIMKYRVLPLELFPVGGFYFKYNKSINPFIIHFNWAVGNEKLTRMHSYHKWYIANDQSIMYKDFNQKIEDDSIILLCCLRDELILLEYFIKYYENIGITHFIFIDNNSIDGSFEYLQDKNDTNMMLFKNTGSYKSSNLGVMWIEELMLKYCKNKWCLTVDADELLHIQENNLNELRQKMINNNSNVLLTMLLDMYSIEEPNYKQGNDFLDHCQYHDVFNNTYYRIEDDLKKLDNKTSIYGGVRERLFDVNCTLTKRNFYKYDFYDKYYIDVGYHTLLNRNDNVEDLNYYPIINLNLHFKFIKCDLKKKLNTRIKDNDTLNEDLTSNDKFNGWNKELKSYCESFHSNEQFFNKNYTVKYDKSKIHTYFELE